MEDHATAQALAEDTASPVDAADTDEDLGAVYRAIMDRDAAPEDTEVEPPAPEAAEPEAEEPAEPAASDAPSDLPFEVKQAWAKIPPEARDGLARSHRDMAQKLSDQGRLVAGLRPIQDKLTGMVREFPALANMTPDQVAQEMHTLAQINQQFNTDPVGAIMGLVKQHGLEQQFAAALQGQSQDVGRYIAELKGEIAQLRKGLDPNAMRQNFDSWQKETTVTGQVEAFAAAHKDTWEQVQPHLPAAIQMAKSFLGEGASPQDVLSRAYELAETQLGLTAKAPAEQAVEQTAPAPDPERAKRAEKAKSVNIAGSKTGTTRELTEDEALTRKFREIQARG